jgi:hypothetical protein
MSDKNNKNVKSYSDDIIMAINRLDMIDLDELTVKDIKNLNYVLRKALIKILKSVDVKDRVAHVSHSDHVAHTLVALFPDQNNDF